MLSGLAMSLGRGQETNRLVRGTVVLHLRFLNMALLAAARQLLMTKITNIRVCATLVVMLVMKLKQAQHPELALSPRNGVELH